MMYATYSEGFRAGGVNRARVPGIPKYGPDWVINHEIGWKSTWANGQLRFNGAAYMLDWDRLPVCVPGFLIGEHHDHRQCRPGTHGRRRIRHELACYRPAEPVFAGSYNNAELEEGYWRTSAERDSGAPARAPKGTEMPYVPEWQFTAIGRYDLNFGDFPGYVQAAASYTGASWNDLEVALRQRQDAYTLLNLSTGIDRETWSVDLYINNVTNERAQIKFSSRVIRARSIRPRSPTGRARSAFVSDRSSTDRWFAACCKGQPFTRKTTRPWKSMALFFWARQNSV
jgi:iron complex outermembrane recepter protein